MAKRRAFGAIRIRRTYRGTRYYQASFHTPRFAFKKWPEVHLPQETSKNFSRNELSKAQAWLYQQQREIEQETWVPEKVRKTQEEVKQKTFAGYARNWVKNRTHADGRPLAPGTREKYEEYLAYHLLPTFGERSLASITEHDVRTWWNSYPISQSGRGAVARRHVYALLKAIMTSATREETPGGGTLIDRNPCTMSDGKVSTTHEQVIATHEELREAADHMPAGLGLAVYLAGWMGLRRGEVLGLERQDVDLAHMVIHVRRAAKQTKQRNGHWTMTLGTTKTANSIRDVMIPSELRSMFQNQLGRIGSKPESLLFPGRNGGIMHDSWLETSWRVARNNVPRLSHMHFHDLRHTALTNLAQSGATIAELEQIAGHADARMAMHYQHVVNSHEREVVERAGKEASEESKGTMSRSDKNIQNLTGKLAKLTPTQLSALTNLIKSMG